MSPASAASFIRSCGSPTIDTLSQSFIIAALLTAELRCLSLSTTCLSSSALLLPCILIYSVATAYDVSLQLRHNIVVYMQIGVEIHGAQGTLRLLDGIGFS